MEQRGLTRKDRERQIGTRTHVTEVLNRKRGLSSGNRAMRNDVRLRDVEPADLPVFYEHQLDADATATKGSEYRFQVQQVIGGRVVGGSTYVIRIAGHKAHQRTGSEIELDHY